MNRRDRHADKRRRKSSGQPNVQVAIAAIIESLSKQRWSDAVDAAHRAIDIEPRNYVFHYLLGLGLFSQGKSTDAISSLELSIKLNPDDARVHNDLANMLEASKLYDRAEQSYRRAIALSPDVPESHFNLAALLRDTGREEESIASLRRAIQIRPDYRDAVYQLAARLRDRGEYDAAAQLVDEFMSRTTVDSAGFRLLCGIWRRANQPLRLRYTLACWLANEPENPIALHLLRSLETAERQNDNASDTPARASDEYVRAVFDEFSPRFEQELAHLEYQGPDLIRQGLKQAVGEPDSSHHILDAGCGTGLCAPVLRPYARRLVGIDLSSGMIERARRKTLYDIVEVAELVAYLRSHPSAFDVIVACDTFNYFGDLSPVFDAAHAALTKDGKLIFSVERFEGETGDESSASFRLNLTGRYSHEERHVRQLLESARFDVLSIEQATIRKEAGEPVIALLVSCRRQSE